MALCIIMTLDLKIFFTEDLKKCLALSIHLYFPSGRAISTVTYIGIIPEYFDFTNPGEF
jgi:hypothetical protein